MNLPSNADPGPRRILSLFDAICIIVGTIIGAGIFQAAPQIAGLAGSVPALVGLWLLGGLLTIVGALCFSELTSGHPSLLGGDYGFIKLAYGRWLAFLFAWVTFWIVRPGNIGAMAITFALYFDQVLTFDQEAASPNRLLIYAVAAVLSLSAANLIGLNQGKWVQNVLTVAKVCGLLTIVALAFLPQPADQIDQTVGTIQTVQAGQSDLDDWLLAMVFIMFSFGGWNDLSFISNEIKNPQRNLFRSLIFGSLIVTAIYLVLNIAFVWSLGLVGMTSSESVATDVVRSTLGTESPIGRRGSQIVAALICVSCLGAINGIIITSPRIYHAAGRDFALIRGLGRWDAHRNQPWLATVVQSVVTIGLFSLCFRYDEPFNVIVVVSAPFFWTFLGLAGLSLIVLRRSNRKGGQPIPNAFQVPLYPLPPLILATACFAMAWSSVKHVIARGFWSAAIVVMVLLLIGIVLGLCLKRAPDQQAVD